MLTLRHRQGLFGQEALHRNPVPAKYAISTEAIGRLQAIAMIHTQIETLGQALSSLSQLKHISKHGDTAGVQSCGPRSLAVMCLVTLKDGLV